MPVRPRGTRNQGPGPHTNVLRLLRDPRSRLPTRGQVRAARLPARAGGKAEDMVLRKILWSGLYAGLGAAATIAARRAASSLWRIATGEEPPAKR